jgi:V/A-type H+/Na+-transporting ATPase subunit F
MPEAPPDDGGTVVLGERELAIGFRLIGMKDVIEVTPETAGREFQKVMAGGRFSLVVASQSVRKTLTETQRAAAEASLAPLLVFVPPPSGEYEVETVEALAKRVLGVTLAMPK